jgi:hypothetical protein
LPNDFGHLDRIPDKNGIRQETQAGGLVHDFFVVAGTKNTVVGEKQPICQVVSVLTAIQLKLDALSKRWVVKVTQYEDSFHCSAKMR